MKTINKILAILIVSVAVFIAMPDNMCFADSPTATTDKTGSSAATAIDNVQAAIGAYDATDAAGFVGAIGKVLSFIQFASGIIAVLMIAIVGINYIIETPEGKDTLKKKMLPIIIGIILVFGASSIAKFFVTIVG